MNSFSIYLFVILNLFSVCVIVSYCAEANDKLKIVNGNTASEGQFPFMASLRRNNQHFCGGSIINTKWILTAAHCLISQQADQVEVVVGTIYLDKGGDKYQALKLFTNAGWTNFLSFFGYDIGLIKLTQEINYGPNIQPIQLSSDYINGGGKSSVIMGWGVYNLKEGSLPNELQYLPTKTLNIFMCRLRFFLIPLPKSFVCITHDYGKGACYGDSGSPLVADGVQIGLTSMGIPCAIGYPDLYTQIAFHLPWIKHIILKN